MKRRVPIHVNDILHTFPKHFIKNSAFVIQSQVRCLSNLRSVHEINTAHFENVHDLTEVQLEMHIKALEESSTAANDEKTNKLLHKIMSSCAKLATHRGTELVERVLWLRLASMTQGPSLAMYTMAIQAWTTMAAEYGKRQTNDFSNNYHKNKKETIDKVREAANRAQQILDFMWEEYARYHNNHGNVNDVHNRYQRYIERLSNFDDSIGLYRAVPPNIVHYTSVIRALSWNVASKDAPYQAQHLMREMEERSGIEEFRCLINSTGQSNSHISLEKYLNLDRDLIPDRTAYNALLSTFSRNKAIPITEKVRAMRLIMNRMEEFSRVLNDQRLVPNTVSYNLLIMAYGNTTDDKDRDCDHGYEAEKILKEMFSKKSCSDDVVQGGLYHNREYDDDDDKCNNCLPNIKSYNGVINAWGIDSIKLGASCPLRAEAILGAILRNASASSSTEGDLGIPIVSFVNPDTVTFNSVIAAWVKSRDIDAGVRAENILQFMLGRKLEISSPPMQIADESYYTDCTIPIQFQSVHRLMVGHLNIEPDSITYNAVIHAWCHCNRVDAAQKAYNTLRFMIAQYKSGIDSCMPSVSSFSVTINKLASSSEINRADIANDLLDTLLELHSGNPCGSFYPSRTCFSGVLDAFFAAPIKIGVGDKVLRVLKFFRSLFDPSIDEYNQILSLLSSEIDCNDGRQLNNIIRCQRLLLELIRDRETDRSKPAPNIHSFHHVLRACDQRSNDYETFKSILHVANETLNKLRNPDSQTYILMFKVIQTNIPFRGTDVAEFGKLQFNRCCERGLLTNAVLKIVKHVLPGLYCDLTRIYPIHKTNGTSSVITLSVRDLPVDWSCNRNKGNNQKRNRNRK